MPLMKLPYKVLVRPKAGQPYYSTRHKLVSVPAVVQKPTEEHQRLFIIPAEEHPNLKGLIQDWIFLVSRQEESNKEKLLPPIVSLQKIIYGDGKGLLAVYGNEVVGVALIEEGTPSVISSSPQYIGTPQEGFVKSSLEEYLNKDKNEDDREDNSSNEDKINSITSLEKAKVAYHEHDGFQEHPVAVKDHEGYFSGAKIPTSLKEGTGVKGGEGPGNLRREGRLGEVGGRSKEGVEDLRYNDTRNWYARQGEDVVANIVGRSELEGKVVGVEVIGSFVSDKEFPRDIDLLFELKDAGAYDSFIEIREELQARVIPRFLHTDLIAWSRDDVTTSGLRSEFILRMKEKYGESTNPRRVNKWMR